MKNFKLIESILADYLDNEGTGIVPNLVTLIQSLPEDTRENALAIITGHAILTILPTSKVEVDCVNPNYSNVVLSKATIHPLKGMVSCDVSFTKTTSKWYKSTEDAENEVDGVGHMTGTHSIERQMFNTVSTIGYFSIEEWNSGKVTWPKHWI